MQLIKSIMMNIYFIIAAFVISSILYIGSFFVSEQTFRALTLFCTKSARNIGYKLLGVTEEYRGLENIPSGACIFASKHQSSLETLYYFNMFKLKTVYCYKQELMYMPMWGRILKKAKGISINRKHGNRILFHMQKQAKAYLDAGISIVIFPEGTRTPPGKYGKLKKGIQLLYLENNVPIVPVALNTGLVIPKNSYMFRKSKIIVEFLPPILPKSLSVEEFLPSLESLINTKTKALENEVLGHCKN